MLSFITVVLNVQSSKFCHFPKCQPTTLGDANHCSASITDSNILVLKNHLFAFFMRVMSRLGINNQEFKIMLWNKSSSKLHSCILYSMNTLLNMDV